MSWVSQRKMKQAQGKPKELVLVSDSIKIHGIISYVTNSFSGTKEGGSLRNIFNICIIM